MLEGGGGVFLLYLYVSIIIYNLTLIIILYCKPRNRFLMNTMLFEYRLDLIFIFIFIFILISILIFIFIFKPGVIGSYSGHPSLSCHTLYPTYKYIPSLPARPAAYPRFLPSLHALRPLPFKLSRTHPSKINSLLYYKKPSTSLVLVHYPSPL